jgi:hypothetical protein
MRLEDFVRQTLLDITNAVSDAQAKSRIWIAPGYVDGEKVYALQPVNFDVAVTVSKEGGGGIQVWSVGEISAKGNIEHVNKVSFSVPVNFSAPTNLAKK